VSVLAGMKYIFLLVAWNFPVGFVDRERMVRSGYLEFPCGLFGISLWVFVNRKMKTRSGGLEFP